MIHKCVQLAIVVVAMSFFAGCATRMPAWTEMDAAMKQFPVRAGAAAIYVYRTEESRRERGATLFIDGVLVGNTRPGTYFRLDTVPARHVLHGIGFDSGQLAIDARAGQIYFVRHDVIGGQSYFRFEREDAARREILSCCTMLTAARS